MCDNVKIDRCTDLFRKPGEKGHVGKVLRRVSDGLMKKFPYLIPESRICTACRRKDFALNRTGEILQPNESNFGDSSNDSTITSDDKASTNLQSRASAEIKGRSQRENDLDMLDGLKSKFSSLKKNNALKVRILTVAPSLWSTRKIVKEFNTSRYLAQKSKRLKSIMEF